MMGIVAAGWDIGDPQESTEGILISSQSAYSGIVLHGMTYIIQTVCSKEIWE